MSADTLNGKVAVVTGGASGIGAAITAAFRAEGARVAVLDLKDDDVRCDVTDEDSVRRAVGQVLDRYGRIDIMVNCAGVALLAPAEDLDLLEALFPTGRFARPEEVAAAAVYLAPSGLEAFAPPVT